MRPIWNGALSFGLVNIPVKVYAAVESREKLRFRMLHDKDHGPIQYKRICSLCGRDVPWNNIVKGVEIGKNNFFVMSREELMKLRPEKTESIRIVEFIDSDQLDILNLGGHYFLGPLQKKEEAFFLLREVMRLTGKIAIGMFVLREKEHVCAIRSYKDGLLLTMLNYAEETRDISGVIPSPPKKFSSQEIDLAKQLVDRYYNNKFDISEFKDTFAQEIKRLIEKQEKGQVVVVKSRKKKEENLVDALKASLR